MGSCAVIHGSEKCSRGCCSRRRRQQWRWRDSALSFGNNNSSNFAQPERHEQTATRSTSIARADHDSTATAQQGRRLEHVDDDGGDSSRCRTRKQQHTLRNRCLRFAQGQEHTHSKKGKWWAEMIMVKKTMQRRAGGDDNAQKGRRWL